MGNVSIEGGNPTRAESNAEALALDHRLRALWAMHPRFAVVPHRPSFVKTILQPALGAGAFSSRTQRPAFNSVKSLATHTVFGFGLYLAAQATARLLPMTG